MVKRPCPTIRLVPILCYSAWPGWPLTTNAMRHAFAPSMWKVRAIEVQIAPSSMNYHREDRGLKCSKTNGTWHFAKKVGKTIIGSNFHVGLTRTAICFLWLVLIHSAGELANQKLRDRFHGENDPLAAKIMRRADEDLTLMPPEDKSITTLYLGGLPAGHRVL